jgi:hypothetical protein
MQKQYKWKIKGSNYASYLYTYDPDKSIVISQSRYPSKSEIIKLVDGYEGKNFTQAATLDHDDVYKNLVLVEQSRKLEISFVGEGI